MNIKLKFKIIDSDMTQKEIASKLGVHEGHLSRIVTGKINPRAGLKARIADALGCDAKDIFPVNNRNGGKRGN